MTDPQAWNDGHDTGFRSGHQAGYRAGYDAGYAAGLAVLDDAARALAALQPSRGIDTLSARAAAAARPTRGPDFADPDAVAAYRARIHASWGLPAPEVVEQQDEVRQVDESGFVETQVELTRGERPLARARGRSCARPRRGTRVDNQLDTRHATRLDDCDTHPINGFDAYASTSEGADHA